MRAWPSAARRSRAAGNLMQSFKNQIWPPNPPQTSPTSPRWTSNTLSPMAAIFSPAAEPGPSPPSAKSAASAAEAAYMERAAKQLKEEAKRERSESAASALGEQAQTVWAKLNANGPVTAEVFVQVHGIASSAGSLSVFTPGPTRHCCSRVREDLLQTEPARVIYTYLYW